jgi:hypothetical protein
LLCPHDDSAPTVHKPAPVSGETETIKHSSSSIIGLRAAAFDPPKTVTAEPPSDDIGGPKPRPPPKPRPWSIVGVDRKSGEFAQVESSSGGTAESAVCVSGAADVTEDGEQQGRRGSSVSLLGSQRGGGGGSVRDMIASLNKPDPLVSSAPIGSGGSVRDRIANMNKSVVTTGETGGVVEGGTKRKGNSLPRNAESPSCARAKNSPKNLRKESRTDDDPRILKLEDDFMYEDTVNV